MPRQMGGRAQQNTHQAMVSAGEANARPRPRRPLSSPRAHKALQKEGPPQHKFKVQLCDFLCEGLISEEPCDPYLKIDFDTFKMFKTEHESNNLNPEWGFKVGFTYIMNCLEQLGKRELKVECLNRVSGNLIGAASVDLQTIACGPTHYQLTLRAGEQNEARGTIKFNCIMKMISPNLTVICQDLTLTMLGCYAAARLQISSTLDERDNQTRVANAPHSQQGVWPGPFSFVFETTLKDMLKASSPECLRFVVIDEMGVRQGEALLEYRKSFSSKPDQPVCFKVPVTYTCTVEGEQEPEPVGVVGDLEGVISYQNLPAYTQLVSGLYSDGQVEGGYWFVEGMPYPQSMSEPPPVWQDFAERTGFEFFSAEQQQNDESEPPKFDELDDRQLSEALAQIDLPTPWEKRRERAGGRMYFADPRSRRMTWKDPRFLPDNWDQRIDPQTGKVYFQYHKTRQTTYMDPRGCPPGWDMRLSRNGDIYFAHLPSRQTTFTDPRGLPDQMEPALDDLGRMYFKNHETKTTAWEDPRTAQQEVVLAKWRHQQSLVWWKEQILREIELRADMGEEEDA